MAVLAGGDGPGRALTLDSLALRGPLVVLHLGALGEPGHERPGEHRLGLGSGPPLEVLGRARAGEQARPEGQQLGDQPRCEALETGAVPGPPGEDELWLA